MRQRSSRQRLANRSGKRYVKTTTRAAKKTWFKNLKVAEKEVKVS